ncbi:MAG: branched-chain-amino-acid transaminase [Candidatus Omnitrophica bacterium]|nr:branched-chain-amino-acid transaminase [Candidatus Omnitrophota bacterium]
MSLKICINGKFYDKEKARISVFDHGLLYGDGVFEGIRSYSGLIFRLKQHIDRLYNSAKAIRLNIPINKEKMTREVISTLKKNKLTNAYIRLVVTRGVGDLGLDPRKCPHPTYFIITDRIKLYPQEFYENGLHIVTAKTKRHLPEALDPRIKSLNYLNNILAKINAIDAGVEEAIMLTHEEYVTECTGDNIFMIKNSRLITPPSELGALEGITQDAVIEIARKNKIHVSEKKIKVKDLYGADECFLTGTAAELIPVVKIDNRKIGTGNPGPITEFLTLEFHKLTKKDGVRYRI